MPAYERDPIAVRYDPCVGRQVGGPITAGGRWVEVTVPPPNQRIQAWARRAGIDLEIIRYFGSRAGQSRVETAYQTAFRRACYYEPRIYLWDYPGREPGPQVPNPRRTHALELRWGRRTAGGRVALLRVHPLNSARRFARRERPYHD